MKQVTACLIVAQLLLNSGACTMRQVPACTIIAIFHRAVCLSLITYKHTHHSLAIMEGAILTGTID